MEKWSEAETIATWIIIALLLAALFTFLIVKLIYVNFSKQIQNQKRENQLKLDYQKQLIETSIIVQERERDRIASDIHDSLIGKLTTLYLKNHLKSDVNDLEISLQNCITEARRISHDLTPPMIDYTEIDRLIEEIISSWSSFLTISYHKNVISVPLRNDFKLQIVRILQESIMNIHKHAESTLVVVNLRVSPQRIILLVKDNGRGFDVSEHSKGLGLKNIELRVMYLNGIYKIKSGRNGTTSIFLFNI